MGAAARTPATIIATLNNAIKAPHADHKMKERIDQLDGVPLVMSPEAFGRFVAGETEKKVIKAAGISVQ